MSKLIGAIKDKQYFGRMKKTFEGLTTGILIGKDVLAVLRNKKFNFGDKKKELEDLFVGDKERQVFALEDVLSLLREKDVFPSEKAEQKTRQELILTSPSFQAPTAEFQKTFELMNSEHKWFLRPDSVPVGDVTILSHPLFWKKPVEKPEDAEEVTTAATATTTTTTTEVPLEEEEEQDDVHHEDHSSLSEDVQEAIQQKEQETPQTQSNEEDSSSSLSGARVNEAEKEKEKEREFRLDSMEIPYYISLNQLQQLIYQWTKFERTIERVSEQFMGLKQDSSSSFEDIKVHLLYSHIIGNNVFKKKNNIFKTKFFHEWNDELCRMNKETEEYEKAKKAWKKDKNNNPVPMEPKPLKLNWKEVTQLLFQEMMPLIPPNQSLQELEKDQEQDKEESVSAVSNNGFLSRIKSMFRSNPSPSTKEDEPKKTEVPSAQVEEAKEPPQEACYEDMQGSIVIPTKDLVRLIDENNAMKALVLAMKENKMHTFLPAKVVALFEHVSNHVDEQVVTLDLSPETLENFKATYGDAQTEKESSALSQLTQQDQLFSASMNRLSMSHALQKGQTYGKNDYLIRSSRVALPVAAVQVSSV